MSNLKPFVCCLLLLFFLALPGGISQVAAQDNQDSTATAAVTDTDGGDVPAGGAQPRTQDPAAVEEGKALFTQNCTACHAIDEVVLGPALKGVNERRPETWLISWIRNSQKVIQSGDKYAVDLFNKYNKTIMPSYDYSDAQIRSILAYIDVTGSGTGSGKEVAAGDGAETGGGSAQAGGSQGDSGAGGISSSYFTIILGALLVILLLVLFVLILIVSLLNKFLTDRKDLTEEDRELVNQKTDVGKIVNSNTFKGGVALIFLLIVGKVALDGLMGIGISQGYAPTQPIAFSHKLHAGQYEIDCSYCHTSVYKAKSANIPSANICMNCHNAIKQNSPQIKKIYEAIETDKPIEWIRVHNLPDFAYFNHSQHTNVGGVECQSCHGQIQNMEVVQQVSPLTMGWCIDCHRKTEVNSAGNEYYDKLLAVHNSKEPLKVANIGGLECSKCHY